MEKVVANTGWLRELVVPETLTTWCASKAKSRLHSKPQPETQGRMKSQTEPEPKRWSDSGWNHSSSRYVLREYEDKHIYHAK